MPRKPLIRSPRFPYHVTARVNNRDHFPIPLELVWEILSFHVFEVCVLYGAQVHALVLMSNHLHLLLSTPQEDLGVVMKCLIQSVTQSVHLESGRTGRLFGGRYYGSLIGDEYYFACAMKYVYRNPAKAGVCKNVEDYEFSTLSGLIGATTLPLPLTYPFQRDRFLGMPNELGRWIEWLNVPFSRESEHLIRQSLRKAEFEMPKIGAMRKPFDLKAILADCE